jgi:hypothetical protein
MFLPSTRGKGRQWLALLCLFLFPLTIVQATPASNQAGVELRTNISTMAVQITQGAPLPPGGCNAGYLWHTTYGGCRIAQTQSESAQCPAGYTGSRVRYRNAYILQANPADIAYEAWGAWHDSCQAPPPPATVKMEILKGPDVLHCRFPDYKVRFTYPDGSPASGIDLKWETDPNFDAAVAEPVTRTDSDGVTGNTIVRFASMTAYITVSWGASRFSLIGYCIGGT